MKQRFATWAVLTVLAGTAVRCAWGASDSVVAGVVRDTHGSPQAGTLVELLRPDMSVLARVISDERGRYLFAHLLPGTYKVRASAAFSLPAIRSNLTLHAGTQALADLTLTALFEAGSWLPAETRSASDRADDWRWALRSSANRPMLRLADDTPDASTSSSTEHGHEMVTSGQLAMFAGDGRFGQGGTHQVLSMGRAGPSGELSQMTASLGDNGNQGAGQSVAVAGSLEQHRAGGGETRLYLRFANHPEFQVNQASGYGLLQTATTEVVTRGDAVIVDAGTLFTAERLAGSRFDSAPYVRVAFQPAADVSVEYRMATSRSLQASTDLDELGSSNQVLSDMQGQPILVKSLHQEISLSHAGEKTRLVFGVYHDRIPVEALEGGGVINPQSMAGLPVIADPVTDTLRLAVQGYTTTGARVMWSQAFTPVWTACVEGDYGKALVTEKAGANTLNSVEGSTHARATGALRASLHAQARRTGTSATLHYRWQPASSMTQVNEFNAQIGDASLGFSLRQRLWTNRHLRGLNAVVEASNLLAQGYEPLLGPDGQTLFLAQVPRAVQGGFALTF